MSRALSAISSGASKTGPLVAYFCLIASSSSGLRSANKSSKSPSKLAPSLIAPLTVRPSYITGTMAPSSTACLMVYVSIESPKMSLVGFLLPMMIGVPVNPMRAQLGSPASSLACKSPACVRCASSTSTRMVSSAFNTSNDLAADLAIYTGAAVSFTPACTACPSSGISSSVRPGSLDESGSRYFWIVANISPGPLRRTSFCTATVDVPTSTTSPVSSAVAES